MQEISNLLTNPLNQILTGIPISVIGNITTDSIKRIWSHLSEKDRIEQLEDLLFTSFLKALEIHQNRYDKVAKEVSENIQKLVRNEKSKFLNIIKASKRNDFNLPLKLEHGEIQNIFVQTFIDKFKNDIPEPQKELVRAIISDTCVFYREAFFQKISHEQQLWLIFLESCKIDSIYELVRNLEKNIPTREQFESIRTYILEKDSPDQTIEELKDEYLRYLQRKFASIELKGVSPRVHGQDIAFDLEEIFVPVKIKDSEKAHFDRFNQHEEKYDSLFGDSESLRKEKIELLIGLEKFPRMVLLGDPGSGKSTLLKYITYQICKFHQTKKLLPFYVPIFLKISEYARFLQANPSRHLIDFLFDDYDKSYSPLFKWAFEKCQALLLLDGLDEVLDVPQRIKVVEEVQDIIARMPENRYIITSRIIGYDEARFGQDVAHFIIQPFDRERIKAFCHCWYKAVSKSKSFDISSINTEANQLYESIIQKPEIERLACNPLLITLIANIHFKGQTLPDNRVQLYDIATETLLQYWVQSRVSDESQLKDKDDVIAILSPIAFNIHKNNPEGTIDEREFDKQCQEILQSSEFEFSLSEAKNEARELKKFLRQQSGFFHEKGIDEETGRKFFGFFHQTFQEYLAAIEIVNRWKENSIDFSELLLNPRWIESIRLAAGILKSEKGRSGKRSVTKFVEDILLFGRNHEKVYHNSLFLISLILIDNIDLTPKAQETFFDLLFECWSKTNDEKLLEEFNKHINQLIKSKHGESILQRLKAILETKDHLLHSKLPSVLAENLNKIENAKGYFNKFLNSKSIEVSKSFLKYLQQYAYRIDMSLYYDCQYYGDPYYVPSNYTFLMNNLFGYSEFKKLIDSLPANYYQEFFPILATTLKSYIYIDFISHDNWYNYVTIDDLIWQINQSKSPRFRCLLLSLILEERNLNSYKDKLQNILKNIDLSDKTTKELSNKLKNKLNELKEDSSS
ncbi:MAG: NACHT domain-containing protein [Calditrichaeota bacterium]|nr:MAG: NACHT domain-containing protein [Calditrichota bacterium]